MMNKPFICFFVPRMLAIGEETGHLSIMLNKIADIYEDELDKTLKQALALLQPIILIGMGIIVGLVLVAILLPLTNLLTVLKHVQLLSKNNLAESGRIWQKQCMPKKGNGQWEISEI